MLFPFFFTQDDDDREFFLPLKQQRGSFTRSHRGFARCTIPKMFYTLAVFVPSIIKFKKAT